MITRLNVDTLMNEGVKQVSLLEPFPVLSLVLAAT